MEVLGNVRVRTQEFFEGDRSSFSSNGSGSGYNFMPSLNVDDVVQGNITDHLIEGNGEKRTIDLTNTSIESLRGNIASPVILDCYWIKY